MRTCTRTVLPVVALVGLVVGPLAAPSAAGDQVTNLALLAAAVVWTPASTSTGVTVCAAGTVDDGTPTVGLWTFRVVGTSDAWTDQRYTPTYAKTCHVVPTPAPGGTANVALTYVGVGGDTLAECDGTLTWAASVPARWVGACGADPATP